MMPKDPTIAIRDCLAEIAVLHVHALKTLMEAMLEHDLLGLKHQPMTSP